MKIRYLNWGILKDACGNEYVCDADGEGHVLSCTTGELFYISKRDSYEKPIEIAPLAEEDL